MIDEDETYIWSIPLDDCDITTVTVDEPQQELRHILYINPDHDSFHIMPQLKVICKQPTFMGVGSPSFYFQDDISSLE